VNGARIDAPGRMVRAGDVVTVALDRGVRVVKVMGFVERRGAPSTAVALYHDLQLVTEGIAARTRGEQGPSCLAPTPAIGARLQNGRVECADDLYRQRQLHQMQIHGLR